MGAATMQKITAPVAGYSGKVGDVQFAGGVAVTDDAAVIAYCEAQGYKVEKAPAVRAAKADPRVAELEAELAACQQARDEAAAKADALTADVDKLNAAMTDLAAKLDAAEKAASEAAKTKPQGGTK